MEKLLLSVDTGIDDALAIACLLAQNVFEPIGITTSYGMATREKTYRNTRYILDLLGRTLPVFMGSGKPFYKTRTYNGNFHGLDGAANLLGEVREADLNGLPSVDSAEFLIQSARKYAGELTLVTTGPLTDLAVALERAPDLPGNLKKVVVMGGAVRCRGNSSPWAEANIKADPHASKMVLSSSLPIVLVGLDVTRQVLLKQEHIDRWRALGTPKAEFFSRLLEFYLSEYRRFYPELGGCALHDPLAVAVAVNPSLVETEPVCLEVVTEGEREGQLCPAGPRGDGPSSEAAFRVNAEAFLKEFHRGMLAVLK